MLLFKHASNLSGCSQSDQRNQILAGEGGFPALSQLGRAGLWVHKVFLQPEAHPVPSNTKKNNNAKK